MKWRALLSVAYLLVASPVCFAQQCPQGLAGMPNCLPPDHPSHPNAWANSPRQPAAHFEGRAAAVAMGKAASGFSSSGPMATRRIAERAALRQCRERGGVDCKLILSYQNQCAALVWGLHYRAGASAPTVDEAVAMADKECARQTEDCRVFFSGCSYPERVR